MNPYAKLKSLLPDPPTMTGEVASVDGQSYVITLPGGQSIRAKSTGSYTVGARVFVKDGEPVGVSDVTYENLHLNCPDGSTIPLSGVVQHNKKLIPTRKGLAFNAGTPNGTTPALHFTGYLSKSGKRAKGVFLGFTGGPTGCTTGDGPGPGRDVFKFFAN